ncbi:MAG: GAF domain-containing protein, partial [Kamptonema sp. SIO4C4]|nr:GAF domain-containing protein [Kamptonema sp. SIO4C4]
TINLADTENTPRLIAVAHTDPDKESLVWKLQQENRTPQTNYVFDTGESLGGYYVCKGSMALIAFNQEQRQLFRELQCHSYICVPLWTREQIIGSILCVWGHTPRSYTEADLKLIEDLAYRAAFAIENARLYKEAQEAARIKSQFLALMSHELRTPMNAIIGFSQVLLRQRSGKLAPQQVSMIERIHNNGKNLLSLISDILDLSKIEANRFELKPEPLNLVQLIATTLDSLRPLADEKKLKLRFASEVEEIEIHNDRDRLRQILINLLSNAIKFTQEGHVTVTLETPCPKTLQLTVEDTGIGITPEDKVNIFQEFYQVDQTSTRQYSGSGLGLAITKSLVELMGGEIELESEVNVGTTFRVQLPVQVQIA